MKWGVVDSREGGGQARGGAKHKSRGGDAEHWGVHKMLFRWYINKDWMKLLSYYVF